MLFPKLNSKCVFKYPFDVGKKLPLAECFERNKSYFFVCFANWHLNSISVSPTKGSRFIIERKQSLKQHNTSRRYTSAHVNDQDLKTYKNNINILQLFFKYFLQNSSIVFVHLIWKIVFCHIVLKIQVSGTNSNHFRTKLDEIKV